MESFGVRANHDIKNKQNIHTIKVQGDIKKYEEPVAVVFQTPIQIEPTKQYELRRDKFCKSLELYSENDAVKL